MRTKVIVVEGTHDVQHLNQIFPTIEIVSVNGSEIDVHVLRYLKKLDETCDIILCLDPDHAGERIRKKLSQSLKHVFHVFFDPKQAISSNLKKIGVEHMHHDDIKKAFEHIHFETTSSQSDITSTFLYEMELIGQPQSKEKRAILSQKLHLGQVNGKTLLKRLRQFDYKKSDIIEVLS